MEHIRFDCVDWQNNRTKLNRANMVAGINNPLEILEDATNDIIDDLASKQDTLVSGTNIKTIGGESVMGAGNISFKTVDGDSIIGSGNISFKTVDGDSIIGSGDLPFKSINGVDVSGSGNISLGDNVGIQYLTTLPTSANTDGLKIVVCNSEPQNKYDGYLYFVKES